MLARQDYPRWSPKTLRRPRHFYSAEAFGRKWSSRRRFIGSRVHGVPESISWLTAFRLIELSTRRARGDAASGLLVRIGGPLEERESAGFAFASPHPSAITASLRHASFNFLDALTSAIAALIPRGGSHPIEGADGNCCLGFRPSLDARHVGRQHRLASNSNMLFDWQATPTYYLWANIREMEFSCQMLS
jgi:hypothetical protein